MKNPFFKRIFLLPLPIIIIAGVVLLAGAGGLLASIFIGGSGKTGEISLQKGLVGHWKLDGNAKDSTPYSNHGTITGAVAGEDRFGKESGAMSFDGNGDYVNVTNNESINFSTGNFSISMWVNVASTITLYATPIYHGAGGGSTDSGYWIFVDQVGGTGAAVSYIGNGTTRVNNVGTTDLRGAGWKFLTVTVDRSSSMKLYVNGVQEDSDSLTSFTGSIAKDINLTFGGLSSATLFNGSIDETRIYNRALSEKEIEALYESYDPGIRVSDLQKGLVGHWSLDGHGKDKTPYSNHGTLYGTNIGGADDRFGKTDGAMSFNGTNDYVDVTTMTDTESVGTIEAWVYQKSNTGGIFARSTGGGWSDERLLIYFRSDTNRWGVSFANGTTYQTYDFSMSTFPSDRWVHFVWTWDSSTTKLYFDGVLFDSRGQTVIPEVTGVPTWIGRTQGLAGAYFNGSLDDVRIYNRALSADEIKQLYESYDPGLKVSNLQKGLVGHWTLDGQAKDSTPNSNHGTISGAVAGEDRFGKESGAMSFDGNDVVQTPTGVSGITSDFTYSFFVFPFQNNDGLTRGIVGNLDYSPTPYGVNLAQTNQILIVYWGTSASGNYYNWASKITQSNIWYHLVLKYDSGTFYLYINGVLQTGTKTAAINQNDTLVTIGRWDQNYGDYYFSGLIDDVRIYNRALSADEIKALYESYQ